MPKPGSGEVLIKTAASALCGSEMGTYRKEGRPSGNLGHEAAGVVVELGSETGRLQKGQRVGVSAIAGCGHCDYCAKGQYTWCEKLRFFPDMHAEYFVVPELACHALPDDIPWDVGVLITGDGLGVPYHTSTKIDHPDIQTVAVYGLGPIGLGQILVQTFLGRRVIGIDRAEARLKLARDLGAAMTITAGDGIDVPAEIRKLTNGRGADVAIEAAGVPATAKLCFPSVRKGGTVIFNGEQPSVELSPSDDFIRRDITAIGSWFYHFSEYTQMLALARKGLDVAKLVTHRFPIDRAEEAYQVMQQGLSGKVLLEYAA